LSDDTEFNMTGLEQLLKSLKNPPVARVGILGNDNARTGDGPSNATIGAYHEFGTTTLPVRSFLRMPITVFLDKKLKSSGAFSKDVLKRVIAGGSLVPWLKLVAVTAEGIVAEAFATGGFGTWVPSDMKYKKNHQTLVETHQLRDSIASEVREVG
jgi:phage gpG-like protein